MTSPDLVVASVAMPQIFPAQCAMARIGLRWSRERLAHEASLCVVTIQRFEAGMNVADQSVALLAAAMEAAGATFSFDGDPTAPVGFGVAIRTVPQE